jgi:hypothetical protein
MTTPYTRSEMVLILAKLTRRLEIHGAHDIPQLFPHRVVMRYNDAVARLLCAAADMHLFAKTFDGIVTGKTGSEARPYNVDPAKRRGGRHKGEKRVDTRKNHHKKARLPDAATIRDLLDETKPWPVVTLRKEQE